MSNVSQRPDEAQGVPPPLSGLLGFRTLAIICIVIASAGATGLLSALMGFAKASETWRTHVALGATAGLVAIAAGTLAWALSHRRSPPSWGWARALVGALLVAATGLVIVGLYGLIPPALEYSHYRAWDYTDKRWIIILYLLSVGIVYVPIVLRRLLGEAPSPAPTRGGVLSVPNGGYVILAVLVAGALSALYVATFLPTGLYRFMDSHEWVHLGGFQRIAQGAAPYLDARTQYGPGYQIVTDWLMRHTGASLYGFRLSQAWLNLVGIALLFAVWLTAYGARRGTAVILFSLLLSPLLIITWWGWAIVLRWFAPVLVGAMMPLLIWGPVRGLQRAAAVTALGLFCGSLAWLAQENLTGAIMTMLLLLGGAYGRGALSLPDTVRLAAIFVGAEVLALVGLMLIAFGPSGLGDAFQLYFHSTGLVFQGMTNTPWSEPESTWRRAYPFTPVLIVVTTLVALYRQPRPSVIDERKNGELLGMAAAAVPLTMISLFRADGPHFVATSAALPALFMLIGTTLPGDFHWRADRANALRSALLAVFLIVYFNPSGNFFARTHNSRNFADPRLLLQPSATLDGLHELIGKRRVLPPGDPIIAKLGFVPAPDANCCYVVPGTWRDWNATMTNAHRIANGRTVFVDVGPPLETSGLLFLADLRPSSSYVSAAMSVWNDADLQALDAEFHRRAPDCMLSSDRSRPLTAAALRLYGHFTTTPVAGVGGLTFYCRTPAA